MAAKAKALDIGVENKDKVYSKDKNIWVGMTVNDASRSTELMELFDFADKDRNGEISADELRRFDGPIFVENIETSDTRVLGTFDGAVSSGNFSGRLIKDIEIDYYPGLSVENVNEKGRKSFTYIDTNHDGVVSEEEVNEIIDLKNKINEVKNEIDKLAIEKSNAKFSAGVYPTAACSAVGVLLGVIDGGIAAGLILGAGVGLLLGAVAMGGYLLYEHFTTNRKEQANQLIDNLEQEVNKNQYFKEKQIIDKLKMYLERRF